MLCWPLPLPLQPPYPSSSSPSSLVADLCVVVIVTAQDSSRGQSGPVLIALIGRRESLLLSHGKRSAFLSSPLSFRPQPPSRNCRRRWRGGTPSSFSSLSLSLSLVVGYCTTLPLPKIIVTSHDSVLLACPYLLLKSMVGCCVVCSPLPATLPSSALL